MVLAVSNRNYEMAKEFAELMNDMQYHTKKEISEKTGLSKSIIEKWIRKLKYKSIVKERIVRRDEVIYSSRGIFVKEVERKEFKAIEKIEVEIGRQEKIIKPLCKEDEKEIIKKYIGYRIKIKRDELVDIGCVINFDGSVKNLIMLVEEMGVKVC